jgi:CMP-2-keto-3-deoxyoctulosonic acid synthetase
MSAFALGTRVPTEPMMEGQYILPLKQLKEIKHRNVVCKRVFQNVNSSKLKQVYVKYQAERNDNAIGKFSLYALF